MVCLPCVRMYHDVYQSFEYEQGTSFTDSKCQFRIILRDTGVNIYSIVKDRTCHTIHYKL